jgi:hypothetical protein
MEMSSSTCVACQHQIDAGAKLCPYCGADPRTGEKLDTQALLQEVFKPRQVTTSQSVLEFARQRQGAVIAIAAIVAILLLGTILQWVNARNAREASNNAVPLAEVTDLSGQQERTQQLPMPQLDFQFEGKPQTLRTFVLEPGAVKPPEVVAAEQAALAAKQAAAAPPAAAPPGAARPAPPPPAPR